MPGMSFLYLSICITMGDVGDTWRAFKEEAAQRAQERKEQAIEELEAWLDEQNTMPHNYPAKHAYFQEIAPSHLRIWIGGVARFDLFPKSKKWHRFKDNKRGVYQDLTIFLNVEKQNYGT